MEKSLFEKNLKMLGDNFGEYGKLYFCTNENLKEYITDLTNMRILTVSSSGDHLLNCVCNGATIVDTFDINAYSPLYQSLKINAILYLDFEDAINYINILYYNLYLKFRDMLPNNVRVFFDFLYTNYSVSQLFNILFHTIDVKNNCINSYFDFDTFMILKEKLKQLLNNHYSTNIYNITYFLDCCYDKIFLSNISQYCDGESFINYLKYLSDFYVNDEGEIYFAYLYNTGGIHTPLEGLLQINKKYNNVRNLKNFSRRVEVININSAELDDSMDSVLVLHK